jgi:hypothetical protein
VGAAWAKEKCNNAKPGVQAAHQTNLSTPLTTPRRRQMKWPPIATAG